MLLILVLIHLIFKKVDIEQSEMSEASETSSVNEVSDNDWIII